MNSITDFDSMILWCTIHSCPIGDESEDCGAEKGRHKVFDLSGEAFGRYAAGRIRQTGMAKFLEESELLRGTAPSGYVVVDDRGIMFPANREDFHFLMEEIEEWCLGHEEVA